MYTDNHYVSVWAESQQPEGRSHRIRQSVCVSLCRGRSFRRYTQHTVIVLSVSQSVCLSFTSISRRLKTKRQNQQHKCQNSIFTCSDLIEFGSKASDREVNADLLTVFAIAWRSGLLCRQNCPQLTAWQLIGSICATGQRGLIDGEIVPKTLQQHHCLGAMASANENVTTVT